MSETRSKKVTLSPELPHQRAVLRFMLLLAIPAALLYFAINLSRGHYLLATGELLYSFAALVAVRRVDTIRHIKTFTFAVTLPVLVLIAMGMATPNASMTMFVWIFCVPAISYFSMGASTGFYVTGAFYFVVGTQYALRTYNQADVVDVVALFNVLVCATGLWVYAHIYENFRVRSFARLENLASRDPLTGLYNRRRMADIFDSELSTVAGDHRNLGLIMIDIDHFKKINDTCGHDAGDEVLCRVAAELERSVRGSDYVFRMGGEEFCAMVPGVSSHELVAIADKLRTNIEDLEITVDDKSIKVTASFGCTSVQSEGRILDALISAADRHLYAAKNAGRNTVVA